MAHDWERCIALADELIDAARDERREPDEIHFTDMMDAFHPIACRLHERGVPADAIVQTMRDCAHAFEQNTAMDAEWKRRGLLGDAPEG